MCLGYGPGYFTCVPGSGSAWAYRCRSNVTPYRVAYPEEQVPIQNLPVFRPGNFLPVTGYTDGEADRIPCGK